MYCQESIIILKNGNHNCLILLKLNIIPINKVKKRLGTTNVLGQMKRIAWPAQQRVHPEIATKKVTIYDPAISKVIYLMFNITVIIVYAYPTKQC